MQPLPKPREQKRRRQDEAAEQRRPVFPEREVPPMKRDG